MKLDDRVYGKEEIKEQVLIDLISCKSVQRLRGLAQYGLPDRYYHKKNFSRYEHSIGVMIFLRQLGADLNEQIAGLLHDVSHTAFSHVVDWVIGDPTKEDHQDTIHDGMIKNSEIPNILQTYRLDYRDISDINQFSLLERAAPSLCVDRIDYSLREMNHDGENTESFISNLKNKNGQLTFLDGGIARKFALKYAELQRVHWAGDQARARYFILADILRYGLNEKIISMDDLKQEDNFVINKLIEHEDKYCLDKLNLLKNGFNVRESENGIVLLKKFRYVDPEISVNGNMRRLSEIDDDYRVFLEDERKNYSCQRKIVMERILK